MPYSAELSRTNPTCFLFLIDQSSSMAEPFGAQPDKTKAQGVADGINRLLQNLVLKCAKSDGIRDYFHVGVIGYGGRVVWALGGELAGQKLLPLSVIANHPLRVEQRTRKVDDGAGGLVEQKFKFPVWFEAVAGGRTPMCQALKEATQAIQEFLGNYPGCFPPLAINISDGKATDGNPELAATPLRNLASTDGNVLVFNAHLSATPARPIEFPSQESELTDVDARLLFRMSSVLPPNWALRRGPERRFSRGREHPRLRLQCRPGFGPSFPRYRHARPSKLCADPWLMLTNSLELASLCRAQERAMGGMSTRTPSPGGRSAAGRFAIADGASESSFARTWADLLVQGFTGHTGPWSRWLPAARQSWLDKFQASEFSWYAEEKFLQGAYATFLGVSIHEANHRWRAVAIGDSCLFHVPRLWAASSFSSKPLPRFRQSARFDRLAHVLQEYQAPVLPRRLAKGGSTVFDDRRTGPMDFGANGETYGAVGRCAVPGHSGRFRELDFENS